MSRCFPFPPPGYEKKARIDYTDLLTKEKRKEKKQKKDKKEKEKREGSKEKKKKDKERRDKHGDKKDRKEKRKDKKDTDNDEDKSRTADVYRIEGQPECKNIGKLGSNSLQNNEISDSLYVQDLAKRIRDGDRATGSQIGQKIFVTDPRRGEFPGRMVVCSIDNRLEENRKAVERKENDKKVDGHSNHSEVRSLGNAIVPGFPIVDQIRFHGSTKPMEKNDVGKKLEEKEKNKIKDTSDKDGKPKIRDQEKKSRSKEEKRDKEKKKEKKVKEISETNKDQIKLKDSSPKLKDSGLKLKDKTEKLKDGSPKLIQESKGSLNSCNAKTINVLKRSGSNPASEGNLRKRKELEINGISHENGIQPNKLSRLVSSSHQVMDNGRKLEPSHTAGHLESQWQGGFHNHKGAMKEHEINGFVEVLKPIVHSSGPSPAKARVCENGEAFIKPPHPDSKYLSQILSVPKLEDFSDDLGNQEWLFSSDCGQSKKPKVGFPNVDGSQVWAEALRIDSADLTALPYVIPF